MNPELKARFTPHISIALPLKAAMILLPLLTLVFVTSGSSSAASTYSAHLQRYPYLSDTVNSYATINWGTDQSSSTGEVRWGKVGSEACTAHAVSASKVGITVNGVAEYQWKALLNLAPETQYCYRVYLGSGGTAVDLLGSDPSPRFWTQVPSGSKDSYSFVVFGDWGLVDATGANPFQASLMSLIAASGARFAVTTGDTGYPSGSQTNFGDLIQTGPNISAIFGPAFWKVPGASLPHYAPLGNHGFANSDANNPLLLNFPEDRAVADSDGRYKKETYCCLDGTTSANYPSAWYAFDAGLARFYVLDTAWGDLNVGTGTPYQLDYDYHWKTSSAEYQWLKADLEAHPSILKFAFFHYPMYSDSRSEVSDTYLRGNSSLEGLLTREGVDIAFSGHAHLYERNHPSALGLITYVTGGGGGDLGDLGTCTAIDAYAIKFTPIGMGRGCGSAPKPTSAAQVYHFLLITVNGTSVTVAPTNSLGQTFDVITYDFSSSMESTPPTRPANLSATAMSSTDINLTWNKSTDNKAVRGYGIYRNGQLIFTTDAGTSKYSDADLTTATHFTYTVDAFDGSGNHSALSAPASAITSPPGTYTISGNVGTSAGTTLAYSDGSPKSVSADSVGNYALAVSQGWTGRVVPSKPGYAFSPTQRSYSNLSNDMTGQDFDATALTYTLTITSAHGTVNRSDDGPYHYGDVVQLTAVPDADWNFANWAGDVSGTVNPTSVIITGDGEITANYRLKGQTQLMRSAGAIDGWVLESTSTSNIGGTLNGSLPTFNLGDDGANRQYRAILSFNTALPTNAVITSVILRIKRQGQVGADPFATLGNIRVDVRKGTFGASALEVTDFQAPANGDAILRFANKPVNGWYTRALTASYFHYINRTGVTQFRLRFALGSNNNLMADYLQFFSGNATTPGNRPLLIAQYSLP